MPISDTDRSSYPVTPDGRYFVVRGRLWRRSDPRLGDAERSHLVDRLMTARRAIAAAKGSGDTLAERAARAEVDRTKRALGERGPVWWDDGTPDFNRHMARGTPYADWFAALGNQPSDRQSP
ncbi:hypothetical protein [Sphingopyxis sp.]|jgi:hypothetical protein|uniref:hypothetical protein n=1 Tax=Sphingopyxis sp. TaxID=1908224 RepID=UPI0025ED69E9|nr:hypothetical protein [Sphingopyxis sp.]MBK6413018.1 hypothetical protein [Sphingopyxis sp.]